MNCKLRVYRRKRLWVTRDKCTPFPIGTETNDINLSQDSWCAVRNSNWAPHEGKSGALFLSQYCLHFIMVIAHCRTLHS